MHDVVINGVRLWYCVAATLGLAAARPLASCGGHFLYLDEPDRFAREVTTFFTAPGSR